MGVTVLEDFGADTILIKIDAPTNFAYLPENKPLLKTEVAKGIGQDWVRNVFGVEPKVIATH
jgi:hypothetical protein